MLDDAGHHRLDHPDAEPAQHRAHQQLHAAGASSRQSAPSPIANRLNATALRSLNSRLMAPPASAIRPIISTGSVVNSAAPPKLSRVAWRNVGSNGPIEVNSGRMFRPINTSASNRG